MIKKITYPDITPENPRVGNDDFNYIWQILLVFGLEYYGSVNAKESTRPTKVRRGQWWNQCELNNITR